MYGNIYNEVVRPVVMTSVIYSPLSHYNLIIKCENQPEMTDRHSNMVSSQSRGESNSRIKRNVRRMGKPYGR